MILDTQLTIFYGTVPLKKYYPWPLFILQCDTYSGELTMKDKYLIIGPLYDFLSMIYSFNQINKCKTAMHDKIGPDDKVLFAGVGHGIDAIAAAERGAQVTVVDLSETMLKRFNKGIKNKSFKHPIRQLHMNIFDTDEFSKFDMVFAHFFLNVFPEDVVVKVISHLTKLAKTGGFVVVGDFSLPEGNLIAKFFQILYWRIADIIFWVVAKNALHPVYDYQSQMRGLGLKIVKVKYFRFLFDNRYYSILGQKK
jgi:ubiquinone/menaquinone biosynthesis C-methylase UbiE